MPSKKGTKKDIGEIHGKVTEKKEPKTDTWVVFDNSDEDRDSAIEGTIVEGTMHDAAKVAIDLLDEESLISLFINNKLAIVRVTNRIK